MLEVLEQENSFIDSTTMRRVYETLKTPYKYGAVIKEEKSFTDSPVVFRYNNKYCMTYVKIDKNYDGGYSTCLAESTDLLHWKQLGEKFKGTGTNTWDSIQAGGYAQIIDIEFESNEINKIGDKYLLAYIGGNKKGYETDPLSMGIAFTDDFYNSNSYERIEKPVLSGADKDARDGEKLTIYKANMFIDKAFTLKHKYICAYNAKDDTNRESIFLAASDNGVDWKRYGRKAIIDVRDCNNIIVNGDPQIIKINDLYVMVYFIYDGKTAYNTFAASKDLLRWTKWCGDPLIFPTEEWDNVFAHKSWIVYDKGIVYHYYCAVNKKGERFIALATSKKI